MTITRMTKLDAVNTMLSIVGQAPVSSLEESVATQEVILAESILDRVTRELQTHGWQFNTEENLTLNKNGDNQIELPTNWLRVDSASDQSLEIIEREGKLYSKTNHTYTFDSDQVVDIVYLFEFDQCPEAFKEWVTKRAGSMFATRLLWSETIYGFTSKDEQAAMVAFKHNESSTQDFNILYHSDRVAWKNQSIQNWNS